MIPRLTQAQADQQGHLVRRGVAVLKQWKEGEDLFLQTPAHLYKISPDGSKARRASGSDEWQTLTTVVAETS